MATVERRDIAYDGLYKGDDGEAYGDITPLHLRTMEYAWPLIKDLLSSIPFTPGSGPFVICDFGTADGINSISLMTNCIDWIEKMYGAEQQVHIIYEDRPTNDFNSLIRLFEGVQPGPFQDHKNVFVTCCGRSFYKQCLPNESVHLGFSMAALSWLSERPHVTTTEVFSVHMADGSPEQRKFSAQAASDLDTFFLHRAKELVSGGRLMVAIGDQITCLCNNPNEPSRWCLYRAMTDIWRGMMHEKVISQDEFEATTDFEWLRTARDISALFSDNTSRLMKTGLRLISLKSQKIDWPTINGQETKQAALAHASSFVQSIRTWSNRIFASGLSTDRTVDERTKILDELYTRLVEEVAVTQGGRGTGDVMLFVAMAKECQD